MGNGMLLVNINALPEVFKKVAEAKGLIASGKARTASEASKDVREYREVRIISIRIRCLNIPILSAE